MTAVSLAGWHSLGRSSNAASRANIGFGCFASLTHENLRLRLLRLSERLEPNRLEPASYWLKRVRDKGKSGAGFACATSSIVTIKSNSLVARMSGMSRSVLNYVGPTLPE